MNNVASPCFDLTVFERALEQASSLGVPNARVARGDLAALIALFKKYEHTAGTATQFIAFLRESIGETAMNLYATDFESMNGF